MANENDTSPRRQPRKARPVNRWSAQEVRHVKGSLKHEDRESPSRARGLDLAALLNRRSES